MAMELQQDLARSGRSGKGWALLCCEMIDMAISQTPYLFHRICNIHDLFGAVEGKPVAECKCNVEPYRRLTFPPCYRKHPYTE